MRGGAEIGSLNAMEVCASMGGGGAFQERSASGKGGGPRTIIQALKVHVGIPHGPLRVLVLGDGHKRHGPGLKGSQQQLLLYVFMQI